MSNAAEAEWVERVSAFFAQQEGLPPITGRILGWLMICEPAEQSAGDIATAISASRASMTDNMRMLVATGLVRRRTRAGDRAAYYRIDDDAWEAAVHRRIDGMTAFEDITADGLALLDPDSERASRLHAAHAVYKWVGELFANSGATAPEPHPKRAANRISVERETQDRV
jgi:hypothetical protein